MAKADQTTWTPLGQSQHFQRIFSVSSLLFCFVYFSPFPYSVDYLGTLTDFVSGLMYKWASGADRPESGSLVKLVTQAGNTTLELQ